MGKEEALGYECRKGPGVHLSVNVVPAVVANRLNSHSKVILLPTNLSINSFGKQEELRCFYCLCSSFLQRYLYFIMKYFYKNCIFLNKN